MESDSSLSDENVDFLEAFISLNNLDEYLESQGISCVSDIHSVCLACDAIISIISDIEIINIKIKIHNENHENPLIFKTPVRIKCTPRKMISNKTSSFLLTTDGNLFKFKSSKAMQAVPRANNNIIYLETFPIDDENSCFLMIFCSENSNIVLKIYDSLFEAADYERSVKQLDLILLDEQLTALENELNVESIARDYIFSAEVIANISDNIEATKFFNAFLCVDIEKEGIKEIILMSINDRLIFIKYKGSCFKQNDMQLEEEEKDDSEDLTSIESILIAKGKIKKIKFLNNALMIIDDFWMLTIYYYSTTRIVKKKEIPLIGDVTCFRFKDNYLIYSNETNIIFMNLKEPSSEPDFFEIDLKMTSIFTVLNNYLLVMDRNQFFYYVPIRPPMFIHDRISENDEFKEISDYEIIKFPQAMKYLQAVEQDFKMRAKEIELESNFSLFLDHLLREKKEAFVAGSAIIEFLPSLPKDVDGSTICKPTNSKSGRTYIRISVTLEAILTSFVLSISFYRHTINDGTLVRHIEVNKEKTKHLSLLVPSEGGDGPKNRMEIFVNFNFSSNEDQHVLQFPVNIENVIEHELYQLVSPTNIDDCIKSLNDLLRRNN